VRDIIDNETTGAGQDEQPGMVLQFGGQTAINLAQPLTHHGLKLLGSDYDAIDLAEDRKRFESFLSNLGIPQAPGSAIFTVEEALKVAEVIGYPIMVRPSYVLGGRAMEIVHNAGELVRYMKMAVDLQTGHPVLIDKYLLGKEVEIDAVCDGEDVLIPGIMEHIERAGVHSGDSMAVYPPINLSQKDIDEIVHYSTTVGKALKIKGLMNIQFVVCHSKNSAENGIYILEVNPRASRTIPFISKVTGIPMVDLATQVILGKSLKEQGYSGGLAPARNLFAIKAPVFSMSKLAGVDTYLGPEMKSTGEVMGIDLTFDAALAKALIASGMMLPESGSILLSIADRDKPEALPIIRDLDKQGYRLYATEGTAAMIEADGLKVKVISKKLGEGHPNIIDTIRNGVVAGVINTITGGGTALRDGFHIRRATVEQRLPCFTSLDTARAAVEALKHGHQLYNALSMGEYRTIAERK
jgi:carbamoyl-phosphate synthase large subunit